jgi:hypothetical protein
MPQEATFKVPRLYKAAAKVISAVKENDGNLEQLVQLYNKKTNTKALAALVSKTLNNEGLLDKVIQNSEILIKETNANPWLFRILIAELLLGKQRLPVGSKPIQTVLAYGPTLRTELLRAKGKLHDKRDKSKSDPDVKGKDPDFKEGSLSTYNQTSVFENTEERNPELSPVMCSHSGWNVIQDHIKLEEDENVNSKSKQIKQLKNRQKKNYQGLEQLPRAEQVSGLKSKKRKHNTLTDESTTQEHKIKKTIKVHKSRHFK